MANPNPRTDHLKHKLTDKEASKGGKRSGEVRARKKIEKQNAKLVAQAILDEIVKDKKGDEFTAREAMLKRVAGKALNNTDLSAIRLLLDIAGETKETTVIVNNDVKTVYVTKEDEEQANDFINSVIQK